MESNEQMAKANTRTKLTVFLTFLRYLSVILFTIGAGLYLLLSIPDDDFGTTMFLVILAASFKITLPILIVWVCSTVMALTRRTRVDRRLLWFLFGLTGGLSPVSLT